MDVQFWNLQRKYGDVTFVCGWLVEADETQTQCQGTSTVNNPKWSMGECHCRRSRPREQPVCIARRELYEGCGRGSVALMLKPRMTGLGSICWLLRLQEHRDMSRRGRPPPENLYPHGIWQMLTAQGGVVLLVPTDRGQVGATCCAIPRTAACNKGLSVTPCRRVPELGT